MIAASVCTPSRAALLTGRLGHRTGIIRNFGSHSVAGLPLNESTCGEVFQAHGYATAHMDEQYGRGSCDMSVALPLYENTTVIEQPVTLQTLTARYVDKIRKFIQVSGNKPFLMYVGFAHVHVPLAYHSVFTNTSTKGAFGNALREMDAAVGDIVAAIDEAGLTDSTMVWFTGDNGPWAEKCNLAGSQGPFTGAWQKMHGGGSTAKKTVWEGGHREPAIVYWPGKISPGTTSAALTSTLDIFPTLAAIANVSMPPNRRYDGKDIRSVLFAGDPLGNTFLFHPNSGAAGQDGDIDAVRFGSYKAVYMTGGAADCGSIVGPSVKHDPPLLFDLSDDPTESTPLNTSRGPYREILKIIEQAKRDKLADIASDNISVANYDTDPNVKVCCNRADPLCRCKNMDAPLRWP
ncbi:PREDICTED: arylsulfatase G-like [Priapulus caudatus]|uniref:Arylsulfatase G-like n=1 Tax=Priapulus caudatus TaxID=37621 RepID=A0ABM1DW08_PRICU|nr:PREDICTED: arylsulfatase G-like [Priapulus caudatus]